MICRTNFLQILQRVSAVVLFSIFLCATANAQATRTWVSGVGDDANPCSRTAPCKTFAGAISKTAAGGEINALDSGGFGALTITKSITVDASSVLGGVLASGTNGFIINGADIVVTLRGLDVNGADTGINGIRIINAKSVNVENSVIYGFSGAGISDERTTGGKLFVSGTIVKNNKLSNISIPGAGTSPISAVLDGLQLVSSSNGSGLSVAAGNNAIIKNSTIAGNFSNGVLVNTVGTEVLVENCVVSNSQIGIGIKSGSPIIRLSNVVVTKNATGLSAGSGQILSFGNNKISGNTTENSPTGSISQQ